MSYPGDNPDPTIYDIPNEAERRRLDVQAERDRIRDEDLARMDRIAAEKGEDHPDFWTAMAFATERLRQFDQRHR